MTQIKVELEGLSNLISKLESLGESADQAIEETVFDLATETQALAVQGILGPPKSGTTYYRIPGEKYMTVRAGSADGPPVAFIPGGGSQNLSAIHTASAPGQYPASDTGRLAGSVRAVPLGPMAYEVGTNVDYGPMLEFGTPRMAARPWLMPSFERARIGVEKELRLRLEAKVK